MLKKLIALFLCLLLVVSFVACKKDKDDVDSSSNQTTSDPTQDYEQDEWYDGGDLTDEEKEEIEDLWNDLVQNGDGAEIQVPNDNSSSTTSGNNQENNSNSNSSQNTSSGSSVNSGSSSNSSSSASNNSSSTTSSSSSEASSGSTESNSLSADIEVERPGIW